jgi:hypothetical protein
LIVKSERTKEWSKVANCEVGTEGSGTTNPGTDEQEPDMRL